MSKLGHKQKPATVKISFRFASESGRNLLTARKLMVTLQHDEILS